MLLSLPSSTESGSIKRIVVVVAEPTIDIDSVINCDKKQRDVVVIMVTATVTAERFVKADFNKKKPTEQSTTMRKPVHNKEKKTRSTLGLSIVSGKSAIQKRKQKKVKNWKERKVHVDHNQFTIKDLWERKSRELRNDHKKR